MQIFKRMRRPTYFCNYLIHNLEKVCYRNDPKFSDRYAWANSADPVQTV